MIDFLFRQMHNFMLWFKIFGGLKIFKPVWFLFPFVSDYGNEYCTKENNN